MPAHINLEGHRFGMLTAVLRLGKSEANGTYRYLVQCDCGESKTASTGSLRYGRTKSCGCLQRRKGPESPAYKHGIAIQKGTPEHKRYQRECFDRHKYNLEPQHKQALLDAQSNACAICRYEFGQKMGDMKVDHDHATGKVRGLLCDHCNRGLGFFRDNQDNLKTAISYLAR